jgi:ubiquinone/menaquinone biosynthesis C-methylase UbiE
METFTVFRLLITSFVIKVIVTFWQIPGNDIDTFLRRYSLKYIKKLGWARSFQLLINPISIIRYFEFDFVRKNIDVKKNPSILDVSSPRALGFYLCKKNKKIKYQMINPDPLDIQETKLQQTAFDIPNLKVTKKNALRLPYQSHSFDAVLSISVVEHINGHGDTKAIKEMWRVLRTGGKLIITTHVAKTGRNEYRLKDQYNLTHKKRKKYFFQRIYSEATLKERILNQIPVKPAVVGLIGEKQKGWFDSYINNWIQRELLETVYDPWYMLNRFLTFDLIKQLPGIGVIGIVFIKK